MRVERRALTDICEIERSGKNRLHGRRPGIVSEPLDLDIRTEPLFKPAFALAGQSVGDDTLSMGDVREMPETNHRFLFRRRRFAGTKRKRSDNCYEFCYLHRFLFSVGDLVMRWGVGIVTRGQPR